MSVAELARKYYPRLWDKSRLEALAAAGRLTEAEVREIQAVESRGSAKTEALVRAAYELFQDYAELSPKLASDLMAGGPQAQARCQDCRARLEGGAALSAAMGESGLLPAGACRLLEIGQRGGTADAAMDKIARDLSEDGEAALEDLVNRVEPALVLVCSILVGLILLSVMLPLMHIMSAIG